MQDINAFYRLRKQIMEREFSRMNKQQQEAVFCCKHYSKCELYRAIFEAKYSGDLDGPLDTSPVGAL